MTRSLAPLTKRGRIAGCGAAALMLGSAGCYRTAIQGDLRSTNSPLGSWTLQPSVCTSVRPGEEGAADFVADGADGLRIGVSVSNPMWRQPAIVTLVNLTDPHGHQVSLQQGHQDAAVCETVEAHEVPVCDDCVADATGYLRVDCRFQNGGSVRGVLVFKHCAY